MIRPNQHSSNDYTDDSLSGNCIWYIVIGLSVLYITLIVYGGDAFTNAQIGIVRVNSSSCVTLLVAAYILGKRTGPAWRRRLSHPWISLYTLSALTMAVNAAFTILTEVEISIYSSIVNVAQKLLVYGAPIVLIPVGGIILRSHVFRWTVIAHAVIGSALTLTVIYRHGIASRNDYFKEGLEVSFAHGTILYAVLPAVLYLPIVRRMAIILILFAIVGDAAYVLTFQSRLSSIILVSCIVSAALIRIRLARDRKWLSAMGIVVSLGLVALIASNSVGNRDSSLRRSYDGLESRWTNGSKSDGSGDSISGDVRYTEAQIVLEQMSIRDLLIGRGLLARWDGSSLYGETREMVHLGYLHYVFMAVFFCLGLCVLLR